MTRRTALAVLALAVTSLGAAGPPLDVDVTRYRLEDASAVLSVRAYEERRRPNAPDLPLAGTTVTLLPRSLALLGRLDGLKAAARESTAGYRDAAAGMRRVRDDLEQALREAGAAELVRTGAADADGRVVFERVPAGEWVLVAWRSASVEPSKRQRGGGYRAVNVWVRELVVASGGREAVELTDRNVWFNGVEETRTGAGR